MSKLQLEVSTGDSQKEETETVNLVLNLMSEIRIKDAVKSTGLEALSMVLITILL